LEGAFKTTRGSTEVDSGRTSGEEEVEYRGDVCLESFRGREEVRRRRRSESAIEILREGERSKRCNGRCATDLGYK
jgi:hypothetical protein